MNYKPGTVVFLDSNVTTFGVVFEKEFWEKCAQVEDPGMAELSKKIDDFVPVRLLGTRVGHRLGYSGEEPDSRYVMHYAGTNSTGHIRIIEDVKVLLEYLRMMARFGFSDYFGQVIHNINLLQKYLAGDYDLESGDFSFYERQLIKLFERGIPKNE